MENLKLEFTTIKAVVIEDKKEGVFTIFTRGKGGPTISNSDESEARRMFERALKSSCAIQNLIIFNEAIENAEKDVSDSNKLRRPELKVEYMKQTA